MIILNILIAILSVLFYLLAFLLFIVVVVLVSPVRYKLVVVKNAKLIIDFEGSWLLRMVQFSFRRYEDKKNRISLKTFGKILIGDKKKKKRKKNKTVQQEKDEKPAIQPPIEKPIEPVSNPQQHIDSNPNTKPETNLKSKSKPKSKAEKENKKQSVSEKSTEVSEEESEETSKTDFAKRLLKFPYKKLLINKTVIFLKRLIRALKPDTFKLQTVFGTGDPDSTGLLLGLLYGTFGTFNYRVDAVGDFEKTRFDLDLYLKGSFTFGRLLFILFLYVISKPVWEIIRIYRGKSKL